MHASNIRDDGTKKVGGYARVSTFEQVEKGTSIDEQKRLIMEECARRGWHLVRIYCDEGASGKFIDRQGLQELHQDAQMGMFDIIMFTKSDRLTRSIRDLSNLWHEWTEWDMEIICIEQPEISSKGIYGKMLRNLLGIFAEWERDAIIERTTSGRMAKWRKSEAFMGTLPYGYEFDRTSRKIVINPEKARICRRIFNMYLKQQLGTREIALRLSNASVPSPRGLHNWQFSSVLKILQNPAYAGKAELNMYKFKTVMSKNGQRYKRRSKEKKDRSQWITVEYPPIISKSAHLMTLERMKSSPSWLFKRSDKCHGKHFLLENIPIFCGECGGRMIIHAVEKGSKSTLYSYYRCRRNAMSRTEIATMYRNPRRCDMRVDAHTLDNFVIGQIMELLNGIVSIIHRGLTDLTLNRLLERAEVPSASSFIRKEAHHAKDMECARIGSWAVTSCSKTETEHPCNASRDRAKQPTRATRICSPEVRRSNQMDENEIDRYRITGEHVIRNNSPTFSTEIKSCMDGMTLEQKKRVIESILLSSGGGKCEIRWATSSDRCDVQGELNSLPKGRYERGAFRNLPQIVKITFFADLQLIRDLVWDEVPIPLIPPCDSERSRHRVPGKAAITSERSDAGVWCLS